MAGESQVRRMVGDSMLATQIGVNPERPTVLIVEDEVLIRLLMADELRSQGIHVLEASNAEEALTILVPCLFRSCSRISACSAGWTALI